MCSSEMHGPQTVHSTIYSLCSGYKLLNVEDTFKYLDLNQMPHIINAIYLPLCFIFDK